MAVPLGVAEALANMQGNLECIHDNAHAADTRMAANYEELSHDIVTNQEEVKTELEVLGKAMLYLTDMVGNMQNSKSNTMKDLVDVKASMPNMFHGKAEESSRSCAQDLTAYTNDIHSGVRIVLAWAGAVPDTSPISH